MIEGGTGSLGMAPEASLLLNTKPVPFLLLHAVDTTLREIRDNISLIWRKQS